MTESTTRLGEAGAGFTWGKLLLLAASADLLILIIMVVTYGDLLALVLAAAISVGLALTHYRRGLIGTVLSGLVLLPIGAYTLTGTPNIPWRSFRND